MTTRRIPLNTFGVAFGFTGLATAWSVAVREDLAPAWVRNVLVAWAAVVWLGVCVTYLRHALRSPGRLSADVRDTTLAPFGALAFIIPMLLTAEGLDPYAPTAAAVIVDVCVALTLLIGGWLTGYWMRGDVPFDHLHPGYFLPTVAGGFISAYSLGAVGQRGFGELMFGLGVVCWFILASMVLARLIFRPPLPPGLTPTMAIELAPPAVATLGYVSLTGRLDAFAAAISGYGVLMILAQLPLLPRYLRLSFSVGTWSFVFSWAAVTAATLLWIADRDPVGASTYSYVLLALISGFAGWLTVRTASAIAHGSFLPATVFSTPDSSHTPPPPARHASLST